VELLPGAEMWNFNVLSDRVVVLSALSGWAVVLCRSVAKF
jgi:hypothetical protein